MDEKYWRYYNNAIIPSTPPHKEMYVSDSDIQSLLNCNNRETLLVRWTTDFDCGYETNWWYCIKDKPFDVASINSKKRYEINKGKKNFDVRIIDPEQYNNEIDEVVQAAWENYPKAYRPTVKKGFGRLIVHKRVFGAFSTEDNKLRGFACLTEKDDWIDFTMLKAHPDFEKYAVNAAIIASVLEYYSPQFDNGLRYICDGERNIIHQTGFQDYLTKYFGFRKAYCTLHIAYKKRLEYAVRLLYPFRGIIKKLNSIPFMNKVAATLKMEEISRNN